MLRGRGGALRGRARDFSQNGVQDTYSTTFEATPQEDSWDVWDSECQNVQPAQSYIPPRENQYQGGNRGFSTSRGGRGNYGQSNGQDSDYSGRGGGGFRGARGGFRGGRGGFGQSDDNQDNFNQSEYTGRGRGGGGGFRGGRGGFGQSDDNQDNFNQSEYTGRGRGGGFRGGRGGFGQSDDNQDNFNQSEYTGRGRGGGFRGGRGGGGRFDNLNDGDVEETEMFVPTSICGRIIGKAGCKIREIQEESGAEIKLHQDDSMGDQRRITLTGGEDNRNRAKEIIDGIVSETNSYGGGGRRGNFNGGGDRGRDDRDEGDISGRFGRMMNRADEQNRKEREEALANQEIFPVVKSFYQEVDEIKFMTAEKKAEVFASLNNIIVNELESLTKAEEAKVPNPVTSFSHAFHPYPEILGEIEKQGFERPSPIQCMAWPSLMSGRDFIGIAQTGTGKTLAFLLPALIHIEAQTRPRSQRAGPTVLVLSPTRELALQIQGEVTKYHYKGIKCVCVYGGADKRTQILALDSCPEIVVATPGRLNDFLDSDKINLSEVSYLVLDEADRMLDMGFEPQVVKTLWQVRKDRQTVMTSATWPASVHRIAKTYMCEPIQVNVGSLDLNACHDVTQVIEFLYPEDKRNRLLQFITEELQPGEKCLVFVGRKADCSFICSDIQCCVDGPSATCIHGDLDQESREDALQCLRDGDVPILVATDLASRGIDIKDITYVINYDFPRNIEEYVHRVGRTGRAGRKGIAISFMTRGDSRHADELIDILEEAKQIVPPELEQMAARHKQREAEGGNRRGGRGGGFRRGGRDNDRFF